MIAHQDVFRIRRNYNQWVANETLEDYALRFTAKSARKWSAARVAHTALGAISFLALEAIGGTITLSYGFSNAAIAILVVGLIIFLTGLPISYYAAKQGTDIDLLTRGAGFGYIGSTITSLIYASFTFIFFALEAAILSLALELTLGIPLSIGYIISSVVIIPLVTHGITLISRFQLWTQPLWVALQILPLIFIAIHSDQALSRWTEYEPQNGTATGLNLMAFGAASAVLFSLIAQIGEQVDFLRFLPPKETAPKRWWFSMLFAGPGWIIVGCIKIFIGSFLAVLAIAHGVNIVDAADPNKMYLTAFSYLTESPAVALWLCAVFVILSQVKINVTNAYAGSIAWSNFFSRLTHNHPGRVVWLVFNVAIALMLMELGIFRVLEEILSVYSIVALAWVGSLVADLVINKPLGLRPQAMEFKRAYLYDINPVGVGSMVIASVFGFTAHFGSFGDTAQALSSFIALGTTFISAPAIAWLTKGKYYIARQAVKFPKADELTCCICTNKFEPEDMTHCPAYAGTICSLCCSLDSRCQDSCKQDSRYVDQLSNALTVLLPSSWSSVINSRFGYFLGTFTLTNIVIAALLILVYFQISFDEEFSQNTIASALINVFFILIIVSGVVSWMFALAHDSRRVAQEESKRQTELLVAEIEAHKKTDLELQQAKETAESANLAKSRYLTGISHELRSPLNAILGYAQLLEKDPSMPSNRREALGIVKRSSEYLADLIEGLLDISRIEAGRLDIARNNVDFTGLLTQIVNMMNVQALAKGIEFKYTQLTSLPDNVRTDEKRLRQILINLLSNAIKYTHAGSVELSVSYRSQVAVIKVRDTGVGISQNNINRIFQPFERIRKVGEPHIAGTGLGLTITRLLVDIMGGDLEVNSVENKGSVFTVSLMLSSVQKKLTSISPEQTVVGYKGDEITLFAVDDEPSHRSLLSDMLTPIGFNVLQAQDANTCLDMLRFCEKDPQLFFLDITMPGMSGWELATLLRKRFPNAVIIMVSADAQQQPPSTDSYNAHNDYLVKPFRLQHVLDTMSLHGNIDWVYKNQATSPITIVENNIEKVEVSETEDKHAQPNHPVCLPEQSRQEILRLAKIGYLNGIHQQLQILQSANAIPVETYQHLQSLTSRVELSTLIRVLEDCA